MKSFRPNWLEWDVRRKDRTFRIYVVEPRAAGSESNSDIFVAALRPFLPLVQDEYRTENIDERRSPSRPESFDLLTFPEAFLPQTTLIDLLRSIASLDLDLGCVHVGLRPLGGTSHLFETSAVHDLSKQLKEIEGVCKRDLKQFDSWLSAQSATLRFNIACLFAVDTRQQVRVCLHAKLVRSKFETHGSHDRHMTEANLLSLVTLRPANKELPSVTIQPLICSDVLNLSTDGSNSCPIEAVTQHASTFPNMHSDHIDIVSVVACSPTVTNENEHSWHLEFRDSFKNAATSDRCNRHHFATFVLANFRVMADSRTVGGLSGVFVPLPVFGQPFASHISSEHSVFGHFKPATAADELDRWIAHKVWSAAHQKDRVLGYIVALDPNAHNETTAGTMLGLTVTRLPRDANRWHQRGEVADFALYDGLYKSDKIQFALRSNP